MDFVVDIQTLALYISKEPNVAKHQSYLHDNYLVVRLITVQSSLLVMNVDYRNVIPR